MLTILPFEKQWYVQNGFEKVEYVGSPLAREVHAEVSKDDFCRKHDLDPTTPIIALLPGSREKEISRVFPIMCAAADKMAAKDKNIQFVVALGSDQSSGSTIKVADGLNIQIVGGETYDALNVADAAAITSGTATLEAGIIGTPMAVVYKTSALNYRLFEPMIDVPHYGLINLIAGKRVAKELIQAEFTPRSLSEELLRLLEPDVNAAMRAELKIAADKLGHGGASKRAAEAILNLIDQEPS